MNLSFCQHFFASFILYIIDTALLFFQTSSQENKALLFFLSLLCFLFLPYFVGVSSCLLFPTLGDAFKLTCFNFDQFLVTCCEFVWFLCCWSTRLLLLLLSVVSVMPALVNYSGKFSFFPFFGVFGFCLCFLRFSTELCLLGWWCLIWGIL